MTHDGDHPTQASDHPTQEGGKVTQASDDPTQASDDLTRDIGCLTLDGFKPTQDVGRMTQDSGCLAQAIARMTQASRKPAQVGDVNTQLIVRLRRARGNPSRARRESSSGVSVSRVADSAATVQQPLTPLEDSLRAWLGRPENRATERDNTWIRSRVRSCCAKLQTVQTTFVGSAGDTQFCSMSSSAAWRLPLTGLWTCSWRIPSQTN